VKKFRLALIHAIAIAALSAIIPGCSREDNQDYGLPPGSAILRISDSDDVPTLDPAAGYDTQSWEFEQMFFSTLLKYGDADVELHPDIATSWEQSQDATVYTFHLRTDARFSNGRVVEADDFRYEIERVLTPATRSKGIEYYKGIVGASEFTAHAAAHVSGIETPDPATIIFHLTKPDPLFAHKMAMPFASAVPREVVEKWGEDFSAHVIGSGPFMLKEWIPGQRIVAVKSPLYFVKGEPRLYAIVDLLGVNQELAWLKFQSGQIDAGGIPPAEFPYVMKNPELRKLALKQTTVTTHYMGMNCQMPPFDDVRVRRAFNYAIDKNKLIAILNGRGIAARGVLPPNLPGYNPDLKGYEYDPARARQLLEEAHLRHDFTPQLWLRADETLMLLCESIQQDLDLVGVHVKLKPLAWGPLLEAIRQPHNVELFMNGWEADFPDPENFLSVLLSRKQWGANNDAFYENPKVEALLAQAAPVTDMKLRFELYDEAEKIVVQDAPWVFLDYPVTYTLVQPWVHDYVLNPMRPTRYEKVWVEPHK